MYYIIQNPNGIADNKVYFPLYLIDGMDIKTYLCPEDIVFCTTTELIYANCITKVLNSIEVDKAVKYILQDQQ